MKSYMKILAMIMVILTVISMFAGCKKEENIVKVEYYSGSKTIYPKNMPAAKKLATGSNPTVKRI